MPYTGPTVFAGPPSVIAQISLESEAFRAAALSPARAAVSARPAGSPAPGSAPPSAPGRAHAESGDKEAKAKLCRVESGNVAVAFGPPA
jgi:hypothetical protein